MFQNDLLKDKRILVTGGGSGLGRSMAVRFAKLGAEVIVAARREALLKETVAEIEAAGGKASWHPLDIRVPAVCAEVVEHIWSTGPLDVLVNNSAGNFAARTETLSPRALDAVLNPTLHGTLYMTVECGKRWIRDQRKGNVISMVFAGAQVGSAYTVPSAMAKAGMVAMTRSLAVEWGPKGIRLNAISPGAFPTKGAWDRLLPRPELARAFETANPLGRPGRHQEVVNLAAFLASDGAEYINGDVITIDGGQWLQGAGTFNFLAQLTDAEWDGIAPPKNAR